MTEITDAITAGVKENLTVRIGEIMAKYDEEGSMSFSIPVKLAPGRNGAVQITTGISYVKEKVNDSNIRVVERKQLPLGLTGDGVKKYNMGGR